jgi:hypothetical protein
VVRYPNPHRHTNRYHARRNRLYYHAILGPARNSWPAPSHQSTPSAAFRKPKLPTTLVNAFDRIKWSKLICDRRRSFESQTQYSRIMPDSPRGRSIQRVVPVLSKRCGLRAYQAPSLQQRLLQYPAPGVPAAGPGIVQTERTVSSGTFGVSAAFENLPNPVHYQGKPTRRAELASRLVDAERSLLGLGREHVLPNVSEIG